MIPACPGPLPPVRPKIPTPPKACDTHAHVFGPGSRFPYAETRSYTPPDAPLEKYLHMLDTLGFARGGLVQGSAHGRDNSAMLDALSQASEAVARRRRRRRDRAGRGLAQMGCARHPRAALQSFLPRRQAALPGRRDAGECQEAPRRDEGPRLAHAIVDRCEGPARYDPGHPIDRPAGGDRSHGPHRCAGRDQHGGLPEFGPAARRGRLLGQDVGRASVEHAGTGLSRRAAVPRGAHCRQPGSIDLGHRLAASAYRGRDAERRPSARPVQRVDAGCDRAPENPRRQSGAALRVYGRGRDAATGLG